MFTGSCACDVREYINMWICVDEHRGYIGMLTLFSVHVIFDCHEWDAMEPMIYCVALWCILH